MSTHRNSIQILKKLNKVFPILKPNAQKGQNGRIAVIGGSFQFTGAPFYSAISSLKVGGDLAHIFCSKSSSPAIKSYSPQIIVHPVFVSEEEVSLPHEQIPQLTQGWVEKIKTWQKAINSWVIGPGLGRDLYMRQFFPRLIKNLPEGCIVIFDADGIYYLNQYPQLFDELPRFRTIITPNLRELSFLQKYLNVDVEEILRKYPSNQEINQIEPLKGFKNLKIIIKGQQDIILGTDRSFIVRTQGGRKRCGGIGDILAGVTSVCSLWNYEYGPALASRIVRRATFKAFQKSGRGLTAPCVIQQISSAVQSIQSQKFE